MYSTDYKYNAYIYHWVFNYVIEANLSKPYTSVLGGGSFLYIRLSSIPHVRKEEAERRMGKSSYSR